MHPAAGHSFALVIAAIAVAVGLALSLALTVFVPTVAFTPNFLLLTGGPLCGLALVGLAEFLRFLTTRSELGAGTARSCASEPGQLAAASTARVDRNSVPQCRHSDALQRARWTDPVMFSLVPPVALVGYLGLLRNIPQTQPAA